MKEKNLTQKLEMEERKPTQKQEMKEKKYNLTTLNK